MAKAEEKKEVEAEGAGKKKKKGKKTLLIAIIGLVVLLLGGGGIAFALMSGDKKDLKEEEKPPLLKVAKLDSFMVNLGEPSAFIKATILLEYDQNILDKVIAGRGKGGGHGYGGGAAGGKAPDPTAVPQAMKDRDPMIRDAIIRVFAAKKAIEVLTPDGKDQLKDEIIESVNEALAFQDPVVTNVYFTEFIVQQG